MPSIAQYTALAELNERLSGELPQWLHDQKGIVENARVLLEDSRRQTNALESAFRKVKRELDSLDGEYTRALEAMFEDHGLDPADVGYFFDELAARNIQPELVNDSHVRSLQLQRNLLSE